jgi:hypothetical protein
VTVISTSRLMTICSLRLCDSTSMRGGRELIGGAAREATQPLALVAGTAASRWMNIARSVVVVGLAWLVTVLVLVVTARLLGQIRRRSHR